MPNVRTFEEASEVLDALSVNEINLGSRRLLRRVSPSAIELYFESARVITYHRCGRLTIQTRRLTRARAAMLNLHTPDSMPVLFEEDRMGYRTIHADLPPASTSFEVDVMRTNHDNRVYLGSFAVRINLGGTASA